MASMNLSDLVDDACNQIVKVCRDNGSDPPGADELTAIRQITAAALDGLIQVGYRIVPPRENTVAAEIERLVSIANRGIAQGKEAPIMLAALETHLVALSKGQGWPA